MQCLPRKVGTVATAFAITISLAWAEDEVHRRQASVPLRGTITTETANEITVQRKETGKTETVSVHDVAKVKYEGGKVAADFTQAESLERGGEYQKAADAYRKIAQENAGKNFLVRAAHFGRASSLARRALRERSSVDTAIEALEEFRRENPDSRFHYTLHEMLGQLHLSAGDAQSAAAAFAELAKAPWLDVKLKAKNYEGRILLLGNQLEAAIAKFDEAASAAGDATDQKVRQFESLLGKSECLVKQKKYEDAEQILSEIIARAASDESLLHARAHNLLGDVFRETGREKDAIFPYLYVDSLYSGERDEHAKALCYIAILFEQRGQASRADDARARLKKDYPNSPWVKVAESTQ